MSLLAWYPLIDGTKNNGLDNVELSTMGSVTYTNGKLGKSATYTGSSANCLYRDKFELYDNFSIGCWFCIDATTDKAYQFIVSQGRDCGYYGFNIYYINSSGAVQVSCGEQSSGTGVTIASYGTIELGKWYHIMVTVSSTDNIKIYRNGSLQTTGTYKIPDYTQASNAFVVGKMSMSYTGTGNYFHLNGRVNDVRVYDHCLSLKEVKEISKALVIHYPMNSKPNKNLFKDMSNFSLSGSDYASNSTRTKGKIEITSNNSFNAYMWCQSYMKDSSSLINSTKTYTMSVNIKTTNLTSTTISLTIDFRQSNHSYLVVGRTYLDPSKDGNWYKCSVTITGTAQDQTRCLIAIGGNNGNGTIIEYDPASFKLEEGSVSTDWCPHEDDSMYSKLGYSDLTEYDCSGYGNNGLFTNSNGIINSYSNSPRYNTCYDFDGVDDSIKFPYNAVCPENIYTFNLWYKKDAMGTKGYESLIGGPSGFEMDTKAGTSTTSTLYMASTRGGAKCNLDMGKWTMISMTRDGTNERYYKNGVLVNTSEAKGMPTGNYFIGAWSSATQQNILAQISDFRMYNTVLSDDDIKELYETSAMIDNKNKIYAYEFIE